MPKPRSARVRRLAILTLLLLPGCARPAEPASVCPVRLDVCFATSDGWALNAATLDPTNGSRPWALLVHGFNEDHHSYDALGADLKAAGWRVLLLDSRGHGLSVTRSDGTNRTLREFGSADFLAMENDLDAARAFLGAQPRLIVGASVGANEAIRHASLHKETAVVALSPGIDYRGILTRAPNAAHQGAALFVASRDDPYATQSATTLDAEHPGPHALRVFDAKGHGTNLLDVETRALIVDWAKIYASS